MSTIICEPYVDVTGPPTELPGAGAEPALLGHGSNDGWGRQISGTVRRSSARISTANTAYDTSAVAAAALSLAGGGPKNT